jgi:hypothetical protein
MDEIKVGDRFMYVTPSGREIPQVVTAVDVQPKYRHGPGPCIRLQGARGPDHVTWPEDVLSHPEWWKRAS